MKKNIIITILAILLFVSVGSLIMLLNTTYEIEINGTTYKQKIIDYITEKN